MAYDSFSKTLDPFPLWFWLFLLKFKLMYKLILYLVGIWRFFLFIYSLICNEYKIHTKRKEIRKVVSSYWVLTEYWFCGTYPIIVSLSAWLMLPTFFCCCVVKSISYKVESFIVQILFYSRHFSKHFLIFNLRSIHDGSKIHLHVVCRTIILKNAETLLWNEQ